MKTDKKLHAKKETINPKENPKEYKMAFANRLFSLMEDYKYNKGITSDEKACLDIGISLNSYKKWKTQKALPGLTQLYLLSDKFGVSIDYLMLKSDEGLPKHLEKELTLKEVCDITHLEEDTVLVLSSNSFITRNINKLTDYLCRLDAKNHRLFKQLYNCKSEKEKDGILFKLNKLNIENEDTIIDFKRRYINYVCTYLFKRIEFIRAEIKVKTTEGNIEKRLFNTNKIFLRNESRHLEGEEVTLEKDALEVRYLEKSNYYLERIKKYYLKNDYDREKEEKEETQNLVEGIDATFNK